ncbi:MAG: hypothetical protein ACJ75B_19810 [Flavisolibacter sp.]
MKRLYLYFSFFLISHCCFAQDITWEKDHPGIFSPPKPVPVKNFNANSIYTIINRIPFITSPKGFDVSENTNLRLEGNHYEGSLLTGFPKYYRYQNGPIQKQGEYCIHIISINNPSRLFDAHSKVLQTESDHLHLPDIFTDTFAITYKIMNNYPVGYAINTFANSNGRLFILNPRHRACFIPVTKEEFLKLWIGKLGLDIAEREKGMEDLKESIRSLSQNAATKNQTADLEKVQQGSLRWLDFLKEKKKEYERRLSSMSSAEKKEPASYSMPKNVAMMQDRSGNYLEKISGHLPYEPDEGAEAFEVRPLFRLNPDFFDNRLPATSMQLIVFSDCYSEESKDGLKAVLDEEFYPKIDWKDIAALMYK